MMTYSEARITLKYYTQYTCIVYLHFRRKVYKYDVMLMKWSAFHEKGHELVILQWPFAITFTHHVLFEKLYLWFTLY